MDEYRDRQLAPTTFAKVPEHVRKWLDSLDEEDIARFQKWNGFIDWAETTGRYGKFVAWLALAVFGASVSFAQGWDWLSRWIKG
jgi:hypothetical protein